MTTNQQEPQLHDLTNIVIPMELTPVPLASRGGVSEVYTTLFATFQDSSRAHIRECYLLNKRIKERQEENAADPHILVLERLLGFEKDAVLNRAEAWYILTGERWFYDQIEPGLKFYAELDAKYDIS